MFHPSPAVFCGVSAAVFIHSGSAEYRRIVLLIVFAFSSLTRKDAKINRRASCTTSGDRFAGQIEICMECRDSRAWQHTRSRGHHVAICIEHVVTRDLENTARDGHVWPSGRQGDRHKGPGEDLTFDHNFSQILLMADPGEDRSDECDAMWLREHPTHSQPRPSERMPSG